MSIQGSNFLSLCTQRGYYGWNHEGFRQTLLVTVIKESLAINRRKPTNDSSQRRCLVQILKLLMSSIRDGRVGGRGGGVDDSVFVWSRLFNDTSWLDMIDNRTIFIDWFWEEVFGKLHAGNRLFCCTCKYGFRRERLINAGEEQRFYFSRIFRGEEAHTHVVEIAKR